MGLTRWAGRPAPPCLSRGGPEPSEKVKHEVWMGEIISMLKYLQDSNVVVRIRVFHLEEFVLVHHRGQKVLIFLEFALVVFPNLSWVVRSTGSTGHDNMTP